MTKLTSPITHNGNKRQAARIRKEENRSKRELKAKMRKEKATLKEKKRKESRRTHSERKVKGEQKTSRVVQEEGRRTAKSPHGRKERSRVKE